MPDTLRILFLAAEAEPFVKVGGLGDVGGSLPRALMELPPRVTGGLRLDVRLVLPLHNAIRNDAAILRPVAEFAVHRHGSSLQARVFERSLDGAVVYFIGGEPVNATQSVYSANLAQDREKYAFFSLAALELTRCLGWQPHILHANDWHTALAVYAVHSRRADPFFAPVRTVLALHNLPYMGGDAMDILSAYGLMPVNDVVLPKWARTQPLPLGLWAADAIVPVSPAYANEIMTPEFGCGLEGFLRGRAATITGILNGLDTVRWDPETDDALAVNFSADRLEARAANKTALQSELILPIEPEMPVLAMVSRFDMQKGVDLAIEALRLVADLPWQAAFLGTGGILLEDAARQLDAAFPGRVRAAIRYDARLACQIYAGADILLMPSRYEPCGLSQMIAMRYGCVPVVRAVGGLKDTVKDGHTGFLFVAPTSEALAAALRRTLATFADGEKWQQLQRNAMLQDFSWQRFARQYVALYQTLVPFS